MLIVRKKALKKKIKELDRNKKEKRLIYDKAISGAVWLILILGSAMMYKGGKTRHPCFVPSLGREIHTLLP